LNHVTILAIQESYKYSSTKW